MKRPANEERLRQIYRLLRASPAVWRIIEQRAFIEAQLHQVRRKVWPFAKVARLFGISPSLLRKWIGQGLLAPFGRPTEYHHPGLTVPAIQSFLDEVTEQAKWGIPAVPERKRPAEERCRKAARELRPGEALTVPDFAARAGVAAATVHRLLAAGSLCAWYATPRRPKICDWMEKERRNRLTRKRAKKER